MQLITTTGQAYPLKLGVNTVGRAADNDIALDDRSMSRRHAELHWDGEQCVLIDMGSTNGTFLGGRRVVPHQPQALSPGVPVSFGPTMVVTLATDAGLAATAAVSLDPATAAPAAGLDLMFRAMDVALDRRKLALAVLGFLAAGILGALLFWVFGRLTLDSVLLSVVVGLVGAILLWCILTFATATLSRLIFRELGEGKRETVRDALRYASQHFLVYLLSPLVLVIGLVLVLVGESVFLLLGRVQYVGELAVSLAFLPLVILNLAVILVAWFGTALIYPTIADRGGGIVDTITSVLALIRRAPGRLVAYMMLAGVTSVLMLVFCFYLIFAAVSTTSALAGVSIEADRFAALAGWLPLDPSDLLPGLVLGSYSGYGLREPPLTITIARFLIGLSMLGLGMVVLAIPQMFFLASTCAVYLNLCRDLPKLAGQPGLGSRQGETEDQKTCWQCGALLAHDQTYCPVCRQLQR